ncbi:hypothetical protein NKH81_34470 [Mesorhizobium sp. M0959]|uniref:hypothetical protein n=1 Tax=Mesorhizobium sp. M0959 TaxID=2957034 RepID=UPI00333D11B8
MATKIDIDQLTDGERRLVLLRYESLFEVQTVANNTLVQKLMDRAQQWQGQTEACKDLATILNDWSTFHNGLYKHMQFEVEKLLAGGLQ